MADDPKLERAAQIDKAIKDADAKRRADEEHQGEVLDRLLSKLDSVMDGVERTSARVDALESDRADAKKRDDAKHKRKADAGDDDDTKDDHEPFAEQPTEGDDDPTKKEVQEFPMAKPTVADSRADAQRKLEFALAEAQERCDQACRAWGLTAKPPMMAEQLHDFRKRSLRPHLRHSAEFKGIDLETLPPGSVFDAIEARIYADSIAASRNPDVPVGQLRMVSKQSGGHIINEFHGHPSAWMNQFAPPSRRYLKKINTKWNRDDD
jgi:hypothetical protein